LRKRKNAVSFGVYIFNYYYFFLIGSEEVFIEEESGFLMDVLEMMMIGDWII
jgi:4-amino-4-deoxy-L-arabinose transferase-like glycosyltransferase